jgi:hypothetical protein
MEVQQWVQQWQRRWWRSNGNDSAATAMVAQQRQWRCSNGLGGTAMA